MKRIRITLSPLQVAEIEEQARLQGIHFAKPTAPLRLDVNGETIEFLFLAPFVGTELCQFYLGYEGARQPYEVLQGAFPKNRRNKWRYPVQFAGQGVHVRDSEVQSA